MVSSAPLNEKRATPAQEDAMRHSELARLEHEIFHMELLIMDLQAEMASIEKKVFRQT
jgi:hypothetical protein